MDISKHVQDMLDKIPDYEDSGPLRTLHDNAIKHPKLTELEKELIAKAIEQRLRELSPAVATRLFGPKDSGAREFLQATWDSLAKDFDFSGNRLRDGAKVGGRLITGEMHLDLYISYKNEKGINVGLTWLQDKPDTGHYLTVTVRDTRKKGDGTIASHRFEAGQEDAAVTCYREELAKVI